MVGTKNSIIEKGPGFKSGIKDLRKNLNGKTISTGIIAAIFGCTGPALVTIKAATDVGYTTEQIVSWLFGIYVFGGLISLIMALYYKMPIVGAYTIPGASMLGSALVGFSFNEAGGAFIMAGVIVLLLGLSGLMSKVMKWLPLPIVMGMVGGAMMRFGTGIVTSSVASPIIGIACVAGFFIVPKIIKGFPPVLASLILGIVAVTVTGQFDFGTTVISYIPPQIVTPHFNVSTILTVAVPLAALVIGAENAQSIGVLYVQNYKPPINAMTIISGIGGILAGLVGAHNANIAGPMTAICSSKEAGEKDERYASSVVNGILFMSFGLVASIAMAFVTGLPSDLINILAGLAMMSVLIKSFQDAFGSGKFKMGAFAALIIAMSGITIFQVGAAFWALIGGIVVSLLAEPKDFDDAVIEQN